MWAVCRIQLCIWWLCVCVCGSMFYAFTLPRSEWCFEKLATNKTIFFVATPVWLLFSPLLYNVQLVSVAHFQIVIKQSEKQQQPNKKYGSSVLWTHRGGNIWAKNGAEQQFHIWYCMCDIVAHKNAEKKINSNKNHEQKIRRRNYNETTQWEHHNNVCLICILWLRWAQHFCVHIFNFMCQ